MENIGWIGALVLLADFLIRVGLALRVIMRRLPPGTSLAWLVVILLFPLFGAAIYLLIGELRLGRRRVRRAAHIHEPYDRWLTQLGTRCSFNWSPLAEMCQPLSRLAESIVGIPPLSGNELVLLNNATAIFESLVADLDRAEHTCHLEFYIWHPGGMANEVVEALLRAAARGVACRVLLDAVGSARFLESNQAARLRAAGVGLQRALPVSLLRMLFVRFDLRLHRKIVVIDGRVAYTGSFNLIDPRHFKQNAGVGQWIDALVRLTGPAVEPLAITFNEDWELETGESLRGSDRTTSGATTPKGDEQGAGKIVQVIPSGPLIASESIRQVLLMAIYMAREELVLTTPYFVPDEPLLTALMSAARRGVDVILVVPARVDSRLVRMASRAHFDDLARAGVRVARFRGGLLHTKSVTVDRSLSLFGSVNLDPRSLYLNFEITLAIYDPAFTDQLRALQESYLAMSDVLSLERWRERAFVERFADNAARLIAPLL